MTPLDQSPFDTFSDAPPETGDSRATALGRRFRAVRAASRAIADPLSPEDMVPQSMPDASPVKWHLAHTTWFFETFVLLPRGHAPFDPAFQYLFNSYYEALGERQPRPSRGLITRPGVAHVMAYRDHVDVALGALLDGGADDALAALMALGFAHEEQHQELMLMDVQHMFAQNRLHPVYRAASDTVLGAAATLPQTYSAFDGGVVSIGHVGEGFAFDNEGPRHEVLLRPFELADRLVTNAEWLAFMEDGGYRRPEFWLSDGWATAKGQDWTAPLYWEQQDGAWRAFGLHGLAGLTLDAPVTHVSFYEADAYARWRDARLPTEAEWEFAAASAGRSGAWLEDDTLAPRPSEGGRLSQMFGDVWEWTSSPYVGYPGFKPANGAVGEYNGKFMINQMILRGGCCITPRDHIRASYRNFYQPHQRWMFSGLRLAK